VKDTKHAGFVVMMAAIIVVILAAGCTSSPEKETSKTNVSAAEPQAAAKYVEISMTDGTKVGGKYASESAAFTNIVPMYVIDKNGLMSRGNGKETGITTSLIATMVTIEDPSSLVEKTLSDQAAAEEARQKEIADWNAKIAKENAKTMHA
jgi:hypothetical protein